MSKQNYIKLEFDSPAFVVGIASNEKIWKVAWNINQKLGLNMAAGLPEVVALKGPEIYQDNESHPDFDFLLFENTDKSKKVPKIAREFRFWLSIKPRRDKDPDMTALIEELRTVESISLVVDLSGEENIKPLLP